MNELLPEDLSLNIEDTRANDYINVIVDHLMRSGITLSNAVEVAEIDHPFGVGHPQGDHRPKRKVIERDERLEFIAFGSTAGSHRKNVESDEDVKRILDEIKQQANFVRENIDQKYHNKELVIYLPLQHGRALDEHIAFNFGKEADQPAKPEVAQEHHTFIRARVKLKQNEAVELLALDHGDSNGNYYHAPLVSNFKRIDILVGRIECDRQAGHLCAEMTAMNMAGLFFKGQVPKTQGVLSEQQLQSLTQYLFMVRPRYAATYDLLYQDQIKNIDAIISQFDEDSPQDKHLYGYDQVDLGSGEVTAEVTVGLKEALTKKALYQERNTLVAMELRSRVVAALTADNSPALLCEILEQQMLPQAQLVEQVDQQAKAAQAEKASQHNGPVTAPARMMHADQDHQSSASTSAESESDSDAPELGSKAVNNRTKNAVVQPTPTSPTSMSDLLQKLSDYVTGAAKTYLSKKFKGFAVFFHGKAGRERAQKVADAFSGELNRDKIQLLYNEFTRRVPKITLFGHGFGSRGPSCRRDSYDSILLKALSDHADVLRGLELDIPKAESLEHRAERKAYLNKVATKMESYLNSHPADAARNVI